MTSPAHSARPPWARMVWSDSVAIYVEVPDAGGGMPYIMKFEHSDHGLGKALHLLRSAHDRADRTNYTSPADDKRIKQSPRSFAFTENQRATARNLLRKMKVISE